VVDLEFRLSTGDGQVFGEVERAQLLDLDAFPAGCSEPVRGHDVLCLLDRLASGEEKSALVLAHLGGCPACVAEVADARVALAELETQATVEEPAVERPLALGLRCTYCHDRLPRPEAAFCAACMAPHHAECFQGHKGCAILGCDEERWVVGSQPPQPAYLGWWAAAAVGLLVAGVAALSEPRGLARWPDSTPTSPNGGQVAPLASTPLGDPPLARVWDVTLDPAAFREYCLLDKRYRSLRAQRRPTQSDRLRLLDRWIEEQALSHRADRERVVLYAVDLLTLRRQVAKAEKGSLRKHLSDLGVAWSSYAAALQERLRIERLVSRHVAQPTGVADEQLKAVYEARADRYNFPGSVDFWELLLLPLGPEAVFPENLSQLRERFGHRYDPMRVALDLVKEQRVQDDFPLAVKRYSFDLKKMQTQDLDTLRRTFDTELVKAIETVAVGQLTRPIRTLTGSVHVFKVVGRRAPRHKTFASVRGELRAEWLSERYLKVRQAYVSSVRETADVEVHPELLEGPR
jgi:hypothetical protein